MPHRHQADGDVSKAVSAEGEVLVGQAAPEPVELSRLYVLAVGVPAYPGDLRLHYAARGAGAIACHFRLLAVAAGDDYQRAARAAGRRSGDAVSHLVARFNAEGLAATAPRHGGGRAPVYGLAARERVLAEVNRTPTPEADGTATWSLGTLKKALRSAPDGLPAVSTYTLWQVLHGAGYRHQLTRTWCPTGTAPRRREAGAAVVTDPDAVSKES